MKYPLKDLKARANRRSFMKAAVGTASVSGGLLANTFSLFGDEEEGESSGTLTKGDAAMLRFAAAAEILGKAL